MTNFSNIKSMNIEELAEWLDRYGQFDDSPWNAWFSKSFCAKCKAIEVKYEETKDALDIDPLFWGHPVECAFCELAPNKCRFFPELDGTPSNFEILKMWLIEEAENEKL